MLEQRVKGGMSRGGRIFGLGWRSQYNIQMTCYRTVHTLSSVAQLIGTSSCGQRVAGLVHGQGVGSILGLDVYGRQLIDASLSPFLSKSNEKMSSGEDKERKKIVYLKPIQFY